MSLDEIATTCLVLGLRSLVGVALVVAGLAKIRGGGSFVRLVLGYELVRGRAAALVARMLPWLEITSGGSLVLGIGATYAVPVAAGLLLVFGGAVASSLLRGKRQPCGCGAGLRPVRWGLVARDALLLVALVPVFIAGDAPVTATALVDAAANPLERGVALGLVLALLFITYVSLSSRRPTVTAGARA